MKRTFALITGIIVSIVCVNSQSLNDTLNLDEVVVTGSRIEISRNNMPVNVSVINDTEIDEIQESAILPLISRKIPGVFVNERGVTGFGRDGSSSAGNIFVRGVGGSPNAEVLVLVDGHPQYMGIFGHPLSNNYVASDLQRVEIIRGPASIIYGSNAMGGVLNFITKEQKKDGFSGSVRAAYGSFNTQKYLANTGFKKGKFRMFVSYNHDQTDGHRDSMNFNIDNAYLKSSYNFSEKLKVQADFNIADFTSFDPGREDLSVNAFQADMIRGKASLSLSNIFDKMEGGVFLYYNFGDHDFSDGWKSNDENYGMSVYQGLKLIKSNLTTIGFDLKRFGGIGNIAYPPTFANQWINVDETAGYIVSKQDLGEKISLSAGIRLENNSLYGLEYVPQAGLNYRMKTHSVLKASVSKGFRSPTISELYLFAPNQDLKPERLWNYELGFANEFLEERLFVELSVFMLKGDNLILRVPNPTPPPMMTRTNSGSFEHAGFEIESGFQYSQNLKLDLSYSYLHLDTPKLAAPENQLYFGMNYRYNKFVFSLQSNYIGGLFIATENTEGVSENRKENYIVLNASVKYEALDVFDVFFSGKNLTNTEYQIDYGYTMPGINFMTGVALKF